MGPLLRGSLLAAALDLRVRLRLRDDGDLKAKSAKGTLLAGWSGACAGTARSCKVTTNADVAVTAKFVLRPRVVPSVIGKTLAAAKAAIKKALCSVGTVTTIASSSRRGEVVAQKPKHGKRRKQHTKVSLVVSKG